MRMFDARVRSFENCAALCIAFAASTTVLAGGTQVRVRVVGLDPNLYAALQVTVQHAGGRSLSLPIDSVGNAAGEIPDAAASAFITARLAPQFSAGPKERPLDESRAAFLELFRSRSFPDQIVLEPGGDALEGTIVVTPASKATGSVVFPSSSWRIGGVYAPFGLGVTPVNDGTSRFTVPTLPPSGPVSIVLSVMPRGDSKSDLLIPLDLPDQDRSGGFEIPEVTIPDLAFDAIVNVECTPVSDGSRVSDFGLPHVFFVSSDRTQVWSALLQPDLPTPAPGEPLKRLTGAETWFARGVRLPSGRYKIALVSIPPVAGLVNAVTLLRNSDVSIDELQSVSILPGENAPAVIEPFTIDHRASSSSIVRGQSPFSSRDIARSASNLPAV